MSILTDELDAKQLELLREAVPGLARIGVLSNPSQSGLGGRIREAPDSGIRDLASRYSSLRSRAHQELAKSVRRALFRSELVHFSSFVAISSSFTDNGSWTWPRSTGCRRCTGAGLSWKPGASWRDEVNLSVPDAAARHVR